jgi:hypothetical protein
MLMEDLYAFFDTTEFADVASLAGAPGTVIYDENGLVLQEFGVQSSGPSAIFPAAQWPAASIDQTMILRGRTFRVRSASKVDDGALCLVELAEI